MEESVTYQAILEKGEARGRIVGALMQARKMILIQGRHLFGEPNDQQKAALNAFRNIEQLRNLALRLRDVSSWEALLTEPYPRPILSEKSKKSFVQ